jgi:arylsulfatase A-like enzyme
VCLEDIMPTLLEVAGIDVPDHVQGKSLVGVLRSGQGHIRDYLHGEHSPCYSAKQAYHFLTDGSAKYVWRPHDGAEQLFDLRRDPTELRDLAGRRERARDLKTWRTRMVKQLAGRPEGFSDGRKLCAGRTYEAALPHARPQGRNRRGHA